MSKSYCSFLDLANDFEKNRQVVSTGKWGCGAFGGTAPYKMLQQAVAAATAGPIVALALARHDAVGRLQALVAADGGGGAMPYAHAVHCSASASSAARELKAFFPKVFPREYTVGFICAASAASSSAAAAPSSSTGDESKGGEVVAQALQALVKAAAANEYLLVATLQPATLSPSQAHAFCALHPELDAAALAAAGGEVAAVLLEKAFAVEDFLAHIEAADIDFADPKILDNQGSKETILLELGSGDGRILLAARFDTNRTPWTVREMSYFVFVNF